MPIKLSSEERRIICVVKVFRLEGLGEQGGRDARFRGVPSATFMLLFLGQGCGGTQMWKAEPCGSCSDWLEENSTSSFLHAFSLTLSRGCLGTLK